MRITEKGQVTIPIHVREELGLKPGDEVDFVVDGNEARLTRGAGTPRRPQRIIERLIGTGDGNLTTDEIMALTRGE